MLTELKALRDIISSSVDTIVTVCEGTGIDFPSLHEPVKPIEFTSESVRNLPKVSEAITLITAASAQLVATVRPPSHSLTNSTLSFNLSAALGVAEAGNVAEVLREAGSGGMHVKDIAAKTSMDSKKLARILRYLATNHWFKEVAPNVFENNMLSSLLDSGKTIDQNFSPLMKLDQSRGMHANAGWCADEGLKCASYLVETMTDPTIKDSEEPSKCAAQKGLRAEGTYWDIMDRPENYHRRKRFANVMANANKHQPPKTVLSAFDWPKLAKGSIVVDVGGGLGHVSIEIARAFPNLHIVLEDRSQNTDFARKFWQENLPSAVEENRVTFLGVNFFDPQPRLLKVADVFLLRMILHDWPDKYAIQILQRLRDAAGENTKLVVIDTVLNYACASKGSSANSFHTMPPEPLLPNMGAASLLPYNVDLAVFAQLNAGERTRKDFEEIFEASGWKLQEVRWTSLNPSARPSIIGIPM